MDLPIIPDTHPFPAQPLSKLQMWDKLCQDDKTREFAAKIADNVRCLFQTPTQWRLQVNLTSDSERLGALKESLKSAAAGAKYAQCVGLIMCLQTLLTQ